MANAHPGQHDGAELSRRQKRPRPIGRTVLLWTACVVIGLFALRVGFEVCLWRTEVALAERKHSQAERWVWGADVLGVLAPGGASQAELHLLQAQVHRRLKQFDQVTGHLEQALAAGCDLPAVQRERWLALAQTGQYDEVNPHWDMLFRTAGSDLPELAEAYVVGALSLFRIADARRVLVIWRSAYPDAAEPFVYEAKISASGLEWKAAADAYREALDRAPERIDVRRALGLTLLEIGRLDEARECLLPVLDGDSKDVVALAALGRCESLDGNDNAARQYLERAIEIDADNVDARKELASLELAAGDPAAALTSLEPLMRVSPEDAEVRFTLAKALRAAERPQEAEAHEQFVQESTQPLLDLGHLMQELVSDPLNVELRFQVAETTFRFKSRREGADWARSLLQIDPQHKASHQLLAGYYESQGEIDRAEQHRRLSEDAL